MSSLAIRMSFTKPIQDVRSIDDIKPGKVRGVAEQFGRFLVESRASVPKNSIYTISLGLKNREDGQATFELEFEAKGKADEDMKSPEKMKQEDCSKGCDTVFEHTYRCEESVAKQGKAVPCKTFEALLKDDGMITVISPSNTLLITPDPKKITDYTQYTHLFELNEGQIQRISLALFRIIAQLKEDGVALSDYKIKWNAGVPANTVKVFHTRLEPLNKAHVWPT